MRWRAVGQLVYISTVIGLLGVWLHNKPKTKKATRRKGEGCIRPSCRELSQAHPTHGGQSGHSNCCSSNGRTGAVRMAGPKGLLYPPPKEVGGDTQKRERDRTGAATGVSFVKCRPVGDTVAPMHPDRRRACAVNVTTLQSAAKSSCIFVFSFLSHKYIFQQQIVHGFPPPPFSHPDSLT